jgi:predicted ATPase
MQPVIRALILKRFRSIVAETVHFDNPTFLVGLNGSGKSNVRDAIDFLAEAMVSPLQAVLDRRSGIAVVRNRTPVKSHPPNLGLGVELGPTDGDMQKAHYAFEARAKKDHGFEVLREQCIVHATQGGAFWFERSKGKFRSNISGLSPTLDPASLGLPVVGGEVRFAPVLSALAGMRSYAIEPSRMREAQSPDSGRGLRPDGSNAANVLHEISRRAPEDLQRIGELLEAMVPNLKRVRAVKHGDKLSLEVTQQWAQTQQLRSEGLSMSDGALRALALLLAVYQRPAPSLLMIEEPETTMHPRALPVIPDLLRLATQVTQLVVTTHSPDVLDAEWIEGRHIRIVTWEQGATRIAPLAKGTEEAIQEQLGRPGELLRCNALREAPVGAGALGPPALFEDVAA